MRIEIGQKQGEAKAYGNLGNVYTSLSRYDKAEEYHQKKLKISIEIGHKHGEATAHGNLGTDYIKLEVACASTPSQTSRLLCLRIYHLPATMAFNNFG